MKSALGRSIDIRYASNRYAIAATFAAGAVGFFVGLFGEGNALGDGVASGGAAFLAWAIGRDLDPDHTLTAAVAAPVGLALWFLGAPGLWVVGTALLGLRLISQTTGRSPWPADMVVAIVFAVVAGFRPGGFIAAAALGIALILDCRLSLRARPIQYLAGLLAVIGAAIAAVIWSDPLAFESVTIMGGLVAALAVGAALTTPLARPAAEGDLTGEPLERGRIRLARLVASAVTVGYLIQGGQAGITTIGPLLAAMLALPIGATSRP